MRVKMARVSKGVLFEELEPGDAFISNSCICMKINVPEYLQESGAVRVLKTLYTPYTGAYINLKTNDLGFMREDVKVELVDADITINEVEE